MTIEQFQTAEHLRIEIALLDKRLVEREEKITVLEEQLAWFQRQIFGKKSERIASNLGSDQLDFEGFDVPQTIVQEPGKIIPAHTRQKPNRNGQDRIKLPADLPVETIVLDIPEKLKVCAETGESLVQIGQEVTHKLAHIPGSYFIKEIIRPKYAFPNREEKGILTADLPESILPK